MQAIIEFLQTVAQGCIALARDCPHEQTSLGLQAIAVELMAKADDLQRQHAE